MIKQNKIIKVICYVFVFTTIVLTSCGKEENTTASNTTQSMVHTEQNNTTESKEPMTDNETYDDNQGIEETKEEILDVIKPDGLWRLDHIESNAGEDYIKQAENASMLYTYYILNNKLYTFKNDGYGTYTTIEIDKEGADASPVNIGTCTKYRIYGKDFASYNEAYISDNLWVTPFRSSDNDSYAYHVYKKTDPIIGGRNIIYNPKESWKDRGFSEQINTEKLTIKIPLTRFVDISTEISFDYPKSWKVYTRKDSTNTLSLSPDEKYEMICLIDNAYETVVQKPNYARSREDSIINYIQKTAESTNGLTLDNNESVLIDGRLGVISTGSLVINNITYPVKLYAVSIEKGLIFSVLCRSSEERNENYENDEMAMMRSVRFTYPAVKDSKIQLEDHDPDREVFLELDDVDDEEGNAGLPVIYVSGRGHALAHPKQIKAKASYNRSIENDILDVKLEISHNGKTITTDTYKMSLGTVVKFGETGFEDDDLGFWKLRLINENDGTVLSEYYFETTYKPETTKDTSIPKIGMSAKEVEKTSWGKPDQINETKTRYGVHEQWVYDGKGYVYLDDGVVTAIQTSR